MSSAKFSGLFGFNLLEKVFPQRAVTLRQTQIRVMKLRAIATPVNALPPSDWDEDFKQVASMLGDAHTTKDVETDYLTCMSTLRSKLVEYKGNICSAAKGSSPRPEQSKQAIQSGLPRRR